MFIIQISDLNIRFHEHSLYLLKTSKSKPSDKNTPEKMKNGLKCICTGNNLSEQALISLCGKRPQSPLVELEKCPQSGHSFVLSTYFCVLHYHFAYHFLFTERYPSNLDTELALFLVHNISQLVPSCPWLISEHWWVCNATHGRINPFQHASGTCLRKLSSTKQSIVPFILVMKYVFLEEG